MRGRDVFWTALMAYIVLAFTAMCGNGEGPDINCYPNNRHPYCIE